MIVSRPLNHRPVTREDFDRLAALTDNARRVHRHLDWHPLEAWIGRRPFYFAMDGARPAGVFAAPPDPPGTAWVRLLAIADGVPAGDVLRAVWPAARRDLESQNVRFVAALGLDDWVGSALAAIGFQMPTEVVVLARRRGTTTDLRKDRTPTVDPSQPLEISMRELSADDLPAISAIDALAFEPPWQISAEALRLALRAAAWAAAAEVGRPPRLAGYQISTSAGGGGHLARLAVLPEYQGRGVATALAADVAAFFDRSGVERITVNTQRDNYASLAVYARLGFEPTGERFAAWQMNLG